MGNADFRGDNKETILPVRDTDKASEPAIIDFVLVIIICVIGTGADIDFSFRTNVKPVLRISRQNVRLHIIIKMIALNK